VQWAPEFHFAFDIDDLATARSYLAGDAGWTPKGKAAELKDAQPVDLSNMGTLGIYERHLLEDRFLSPVSQPRSTPNARFERLVDIRARDNDTFGLTGTEIGLDQDFPQLFDDKR
jgi:hypothetical protein